MDALKDFMVFSAEALKKARLKKGLSVRDLATLTGLSPSHISNIETGKRSPRANEIQSIKEVLDVPPIVIM